MIVNCHINILLSTGYFRVYISGTTAGTRGIFLLFLPKIIRTTLQKTNETAGRTQSTSAAHGILEQLRDLFSLSRISPGESPSRNKPATGPFSEPAKSNPYHHKKRAYISDN
jgi:hypothetical protein